MGRPTAPEMPKGKTVIKNVGMMLSGAYGKTDPRRRYACHH